MRPYQKTLIITAGMIVLLALAIPVGQWWLRGKIKNAVEDLYPGMEYQINTGQIRVRLLSRSVTIDQIKVAFTPNEADTARGPVRMLDAGLQRLSLNGVGFKKVDGKYALSVRSLEFDGPEATILLAVRDTTAVVPKKKRGFPELLESLTVNRIVIRDGKFSCKKPHNGEFEEFSAEGFQLEIGKLRIDSATVITELLVSEPLRIMIEKFGYTFQHNSVCLGISGLDADTEKRTITLDSLHLEPLLPRYEYAAKVEGHPDWTDIATGRVNLYGIDIAALLQQNRLKIDSATIDSASVASFKNRKIARVERLKSIFYLGVQKFPVQIDVPLVRFQKIGVEYEEMPVHGSTSGKIFLDRLQGSFDGLTNIDSIRKHYTLTAEGRLEGRAPLHVVFTFPVAAENDQFAIRGHVGAMELAAINPMVLPLSRVRIDSGRMDRLDFTITGNRAKSAVEATFLYHGLSIAAVKERDHQLVERTLVSTFANRLVRRDNPNKNGTLTTTGTFERDPYKSQFNYLWKSLLPGIANTVVPPREGLEQRKERRETRQQQRIERQR